MDRHKRSIKPKKKIPLDKLINILFKLYKKREKKIRDVSIPIRWISSSISQDILHETYPVSNLSLRQTKPRQLFITQGNIDDCSYRIFCWTIDRALDTWCRGIMTPFRILSWQQFFVVFSRNSKTTIRLYIFAAISRFFISLPSIISRLLTLYCCLFGAECESGIWKPTSIYRQWFLMTARRREKRKMTTIIQKSRRKERNFQTYSSYNSILQIF